MIVTGKLSKDENRGDGRSSRYGGYRGDGHGGGDNYYYLSQVPSKSTYTYGTDRSEGLSCGDGTGNGDGTLLGDGHSEARDPSDR